MGDHKPPVEQRRSVVYVVDGDATVREAIRRLLRPLDVVVREFSSGGSFLESFEPDRAACLITELHLPDMTGLQLQRSLTSKNTCPPTIVIASHGDVSGAVEAMKAGAVEFVEKPFISRVLVDRVRESVARVHRN